MPTDLHLLIHPSPILNRSVRPVTSQVASFIEPLTWFESKWTRHKPLRSQLWSIYISVRQPISSNIEITDYSYWHQSHICIQDIGLYIHQRSTHRNYFV